MVEYDTPENVYKLDANSVNIAVYPNPASNKIFVKSYGEQSILAVSIINLAGSELMQISPDKKISTVDISQLQAGIYFIKIKLDNQETVTQRLIVK